jgi:hypothetical protein
MTVSTSTTGSTSGDVQQTSTPDSQRAHAEGLSWLSAHILWERRLRELNELEVIRRAADGAVIPAAVAASGAMGHHRDELDPVGGVANGMEVVGSLA